MTGLKIAFLFHSVSNDNLGVGALGVSDALIVLGVADALSLPVSITFIEGHGDRKPYFVSDRIFHSFVRPLRRPWSFFKEISKFDLVIDIGGGDSFTDIYGFRRIALMYLMKYLTHFAGVPLVLAPQTFGPFRHWLSKLLAIYSVGRCVLVATRDDLSKQALKSAGFDGLIVDSSDVALKLPCGSGCDLVESEVVRVGVNVSGLLWIGGYNRKNMFDLTVDYPGLMKEIVRRFLDRPEPCEVHLISHVVSMERDSVEDDYSASVQLAKDFPDVILAPAFKSPSEAKSYISKLDFFTGARMHACVAAFSTGVPVVPLAYSRKFSGLFGSLGYNETVDCASLSEDEILARLFDAFDRRSELQVAQARAFEFGVSKLASYETALGDLLKELGRSKFRSI